MSPRSQLSCRPIGPHHRAPGPRPWAARFACAALSSRPSSRSDPAPLEPYRPAQDRCRHLAAARGDNARRRHHATPFGAQWPKLSGALRPLHDPPCPTPPTESPSRDRPSLVATFLSVSNASLCSQGGAPGPGNARLGGGDLLNSTGEPAPLRAWLAALVDFVEPSGAQNHPVEHRSFPPGVCGGRSAAPGPRKRARART